MRCVSWMKQLQREREQLVLIDPFFSSFMTLVISLTLLQQDTCIMFPVAIMMPIPVINRCVRRWKQVNNAKWKTIRWWNIFKMSQCFNFIFSFLLNARNRSHSDRQNDHVKHAQKKVRISRENSIITCEFTKKKGQASLFIQYSTIQTLGN